MHKKNLFQSTFIFTLTLFVVFVLSLIGFNGFVLYKKFLDEESKIRQEILISKKESIKNEVDFFNNLIDESRLKLEQKIKQTIKQRVELAHNIALNLSLNNANEKMIIEALRKINFSNKDEYIFLLKLDGTMLLLPNFPNYETKNMIQKMDLVKKDVILKMINLAKNQKESYLEYKWMKKDQNSQKQKTSYIKYFEPLDCIIGSGIYKEDFEKLLQETILEKIETHRFDKDRSNYIFAATYDGLSLAGPGKGKNVYNVEDVNGLKVVQELIKTAKNGSGYVEYTMPLGDMKVKKISYVVGNDNWQWYIGAGESLKDINLAVDDKKQELLAELYFDLIFIVTLSFIFLIVFYFVFLQKKRNLDNEMSSFILSLNELFNENKKIDSSKINFEEFDKISKQANMIYDTKQTIEKELKRKEYLLFQQSKMASMGEMVENIAHQWRQPLSIITTATSGIQIKKEFNDLDDEFLGEAIESIDNNAHYLSSTIDDFRNFFYETAKKEEFYFEDVLNKALNLINSKLTSSNIEVILDLEYKKITSFKNELLQVILIILNNSKDAFDENNQDNKYIFIDAHCKEDYYLISFKDNANGINLENKDQIFKAYFTTKDKIKGTGIGLHMAKEIITKHIEGEIFVNNTSYTYNDISCKGAVFTIKIPNCN